MLVQDATPSLPRLKEIYIELCKFIDPKDASVSVSNWCLVLHVYFIVINFVGSSCEAFLKNMQKLEAT